MSKGNRIKFKIKGLNQEKTINKLIKVANVYNFHRDSHDQCQFEVDYNKAKVVKTLLKENNMEIVSQSHLGIFSSLKRLFTSYGVIAALAICAIVYPIQYAFIWKIEVVGESSLDEKDVKNFVENNLKSKIKGKIDTKQLEFDIKSNFNEISSVSAAIVGQTLILNLNEAIIPEEMEGEYSALVSNWEGLITEINLIQGTLAVNEGDIVCKGDVLVYPYVIDAQGQQRAVAPKADIYADVWLSEKTMHYDYKITVRRTGRTKVTSQVYLNNILIYSQAKSHDFEEYETEIVMQPLTKNLLLPLKLKKITLYETETVEIKEDLKGLKRK